MAGFLQDFVRKLRCKLGSHRWGEWEYDAPDSCHMHLVCQHCLRKLTVEIHQWEVIKDEGCIKEKRCRRCQQQTRTDGHHWVLLSTEKYQQDQDSGSVFETYQCSICGATNESEYNYYRGRYG